MQHEAPPFRLRGHSEIPTLCVAPTQDLIRLRSSALDRHFGSLACAARFRISTRVNRQQWQQIGPEVVYLRQAEYIECFADAQCILPGMQVVEVHARLWQGVYQGGRGTWLTLEELDETHHSINQRVIGIDSYARP